MRADFRIMLHKLIALLGAVGSVEAFYIPGESATHWSDRTFLEYMRILTFHL